MFLGGQLTLLHPGCSQAWTRFPFFALLTRCVVGVYVRGASRGIDECRMLEALGRREPTWFSVSLGGIVDRSSVIGTWALFELSSPGLSVPLFFRGRLRGDKCGEFPDCIEDDELW
jgi:hypothetical protein